MWKIVVKVAKKLPKCCLFSPDVLMLDNDENDYNKNKVPIYLLQESPSKSPFLLMTDGQKNGELKINFVANDFMSVSPLA